MDRSQGAHQLLHLGREQVLGLVVKPLFQGGLELGLQPGDRHESLARRYLLLRKFLLPFTEGDALAVDLFDQLLVKVGNRTPDLVEIGLNLLAQRILLLAEGALLCDLPAKGDDLRRYLRVVLHAIAALVLATEGDTHQATEAPRVPLRRRYRLHEKVIQGEESRDVVRVLGQTEVREVVVHQAAELLVRAAPQMVPVPGCHSHLPSQRYGAHPLRASCRPRRCP